MFTRSRWLFGFALAAAAVAPWLVVSDVSGQPVDGRLRTEPSVVRVDIETLEAIRGVRFVGPIVQSVQPVGSGPKPAASPAGAGPYSTNWNGDAFALSGSLPVPEPLSAWLEASLDGRLATKNVSVISVDTFAHELWRWRFMECAPAQMAYDVDASTWTLRLSFARMRYQSASAPQASTDPAAAAPPRADEPVGAPTESFLRLTLRKGSALEAGRLEPSDVVGQVAVTPRRGGRIVIPWADIKSVEPATDAPSPR